MREMVERGQDAGQMIGMVKRRRERSTQPQMPGSARHHWQHDHRVEIGELATVAQIGVEAALIDVGEAQRVGEKTAVKAGRLEHPSHVLVALRLEDVAEIGLGVPPRTRELRGRAGLDIGQEVHVPVAHRSFLIKDGRSSQSKRRH